MRKSYVLLALSLLLFPLVSSAQVMFEKSIDKGSMTSGNDRYEAGSNISLASDVAGDYFAAGGTVEISKKVSQDIIVAGGTILMTGEVGKSVKVFGGTVIINSTIPGDLMVFGGQVDVRKGTKIGGNMFLNGGNVTFEGETAGDAFINGGNINLAGNLKGNTIINSQTINVLPGAKLDGNLAYSAAKANPQLENATSGVKKFTLMERRTDKGNDFRKSLIGFSVAYVLYRFIFLALFGTLLYFGFEKIFKEVGENIEKKPGKSFLYGFLYFAAMPLAILIVLLTIIGIPIGLFMLFIYIFGFVFYKLITVMAFSAFFIHKYLKDKNSTWKKFGIIVLVALFIAPWSLVDLIFAFFAFGAVMQKKFKIYGEVIRGE